MPPPTAGSALTPTQSEVARFQADLARCGAEDDLPVLVAVSGGADSLALLLLAHAALGDRCVAATVDHRIRAASTSEAEKVARLCAERDIDHTILTGELPARVGRTANLSARARALRYRLLEEHSEELGWCHIATAHHADDQLETLIMRLNRGAGVAGLAGIREHANSILIRPLLRWRRAELAALVARCGLTPVDDPSNVDDRFDRARLRKELATASWLDADRFAQSARALGDAEDALAWATRGALREHCTFEPGRVTIDVQSLPTEILRRLVLAGIEHVDPAADPTGPAVVRFIELLLNNRPAMLGRVLAGVRRRAEGQTCWLLREAPSRRAS